MPNTSEADRVVRNLAQAERSHQEDESSPSLQRQMLRELKSINSSLTLIKIGMAAILIFYILEMINP